MLFQGESYNEEKAEKLNEALGWLNSLLEGRAFVAGDNLTIADITIIVTLTNLDVSLDEALFKYYDIDINEIDDEC